MRLMTKETERFAGRSDHGSRTRGGGEKSAFRENRSFSSGLGEQSPREEPEKEKRELYARVKKAFKQKATGVDNNASVTRAQLKKIFPAEMETLLVGHNSPANVHKFLEARYKAIVLTNAAGWSRVTLKGKTTRITWKEGSKPNGKYSVGFPILSKK